MHLLSVVMFFVLCFLPVIISANIIGGPVRTKSLNSDSKEPTIIDSRNGPNQFLAYWNVPTFQCKSKGVLFTDVYKNYGIIQNNNDEFRGEKITIMYDPGNFPALIQENSKGSYEFRNGGVPQEGDLDLHLEKFKDSVVQQIPDENYNGVAVVDFESWRPNFRQNFGSLQPYKDESYKIERRKHPLWPNSWVEKQAAKNFEHAGRKFVEQTMLLAKELRPYAQWGYYAYPYCFNMNSQKNQECSDQVKKENDEIQWMWDSTDLLLPSIYFNIKKLNSQERLQMVAGRVNEAKRIKKRTKREKSVLLYFWYKYQDDSDQFVTKEDVYNTLEHMYNQGLDGVILWGSSNDVNSGDKCLQLRDYVNNILGPAVKQFTQSIRTRSLNLNDEPTTNFTTTNDEQVAEESEVVESVPEGNKKDSLSYYENASVFIENSSMNESDKNRVSRFNDPIINPIEITTNNSDQKTNKVDDNSNNITEFKSISDNPQKENDNINIKARMKNEGVENNDEKEKDTVNKSSDTKIVDIEIDNESIEGIIQRANEEEEVSNLSMDTKEEDEQNKDGGKESISGEINMEENNDNQNKEVVRTNFASKAEGKNVNNDKTSHFNNNETIDLKSEEQSTDEKEASKKKDSKQFLAFLMRARYYRLYYKPHLWQLERQK